MPIILVLWLLTLHLVADFFAQTNWQAVNKSRRLDALLKHVGIYSAILALGTLNLTFGIVTFIAHFTTDYITSRITRRQYPLMPMDENGRWIDAEGSLNNSPFLGIRFRRSRHGFFGTVGVDQWLHGVQLMLTAAWLLK